MFVGQSRLIAYTNRHTSLGIICVALDHYIELTSVQAIDQSPVEKLEFRTFCDVCLSVGMSTKHLRRP